MKPTYTISMMVRREGRAGEFRTLHAHSPLSARLLLALSRLVPGSAYNTVYPKCYL